MAKKKTDITIRSSAAEYLTFIAAAGGNADSVEMRYQDENIWLTQKMMAALYDVEVNTVNYHIKKVLTDSELDPGATIRKYRIVQMEGARQVSREVEHYSLQMIIAVGFKVNSARAVQFRKWVNQIAKDYTIQGWVMDSERLKNGGSILTDHYFERQLQKVLEIRMCNVSIGCSPSLKRLNLELPHNQQPREGEDEQPIETLHLGPVNTI